MRNKAQTTIEYMVVFAILVAALLSMQVYLKRGMQGRMRSYVGQISETGYSPGATDSLSTVTRNIEEKSSSFTEQRLSPEGRVRVSESNFQINQVTDRSETTRPFAEEPRRQ